jgi:hypothetical protein
MGVCANLTMKSVGPGVTLSGTYPEKPRGEASQNLPLIDNMFQFGEKDMHARKLTGLAMATAAAALFATAGIAPVAAKEEAKVHCNGVNQCKGQSACQTANNACKGQNSCKGKGWLYLGKSECDAAQAKMKQEMGK